MSNNYREDFEKFIKTKYLNSNEIDFRLESDGSDYRSDELEEWFWIWQAAWNASHQRCAEICSEPIGGESLSDYAAGAINISLEHVESIQNDKVEV